MFFIDLHSHESKIITDVRRIILSLDKICNNIDCSENIHICNTDRFAHDTDVLINTELLSKKLKAHGHENKFGLHRKNYIPIMSHKFKLI